MLLTIKIDTPAKQNGCIDVSLDKNGNQYSIFKIIPTDKMKRNGHKIYDSDVIEIKETKDNNYSLHVAQEKTESQGVRFDVNGSETASKFRIKCYMTDKELNIDKVN